MSHNPQSLEDFYITKVWFNPVFVIQFLKGYPSDNKITGFSWYRWLPGSFPGSSLALKDSPVVLQPNRKKPNKIPSLSPCH